jgi:hypothetical protein
MESIVEYDKAVFRGGRNAFVKMACSPTAFSYEIAAIEPYCGGHFRRKKDMPFDLEYDEGDAHWRTQNRCPLISNTTRAMLIGARKTDDNAQRVQQQRKLKG